MAIEIPSSLPPLPVAPSTPSAASAPNAQGGFAGVLAKLVNDVDSSNAAANEAVTQMLAGKVDVHEAMIALQRAETSLELVVQMRNKLVQAYQDIMRMPI